MKRMIYCLIGLVFAASVYGVPFEGYVQIAITSPEMNNTMDINIKGSKIKMVPQKQIGTVKGYMLLDSATKKGYLIATDEKYYAEIPFNAISAKASTGASKPLPSGATASILGYSCQQWTYKSTTANIEYWVSSGLDISGLSFLSFQGINTKVQSEARQFLTFFVDKKMFPLKVVETGSDGKIRLKMEVLKITAKTQDAKLFNIPAGFQSYADYIKTKRNK